jgi:hypothetical protein
MEVASRRRGPLQAAQEKGTRARKRDGDGFYRRRSKKFGISAIFLPRLWQAKSRVPDLLPKKGDLHF